MKFSIFLTVTILALVLTTTALASGDSDTASQEQAAAAVGEAQPGIAIALCTQVTKTGSCDTYQGRAYCNTTGGVGTLSCPTGYHHVSSSSTPKPCVPAGAACTRTINCCLDEDTEVEPLSALSVNPSMELCSGPAAQAVR
jgi:hypothetical protein